MLEIKIVLLNRALAQFLKRHPDARHRLNDVCAGFSNCVDCYCGLAADADTRRRFGVAEAHIGDVSDGHPAHASIGGVAGAAQHNLADGGDCVQLTLGAHHVAPLALFDVTG